MIPPPACPLLAGSDERAEVFGSAYRRTRGQAEGIIPPPPYHGGPTTHLSAAAVIRLANDWLGFAEMRWQAAGASESTEVGG